MRPGLFSNSEPEEAPVDAFDSPLPTSSEPTQTYSLEPTEPAPFPSVDNEQIHTGDWLAATEAIPSDNVIAEPAPSTEGVSLFGRPVASETAAEQPAVEPAPSWPSADWPSSNTQTGLPVPATNATDWPATASDTTDPLLSAGTPTELDVLGSTDVAGAPTAPSSEAPVKKKATRESFFKRILSRKEDAAEATAAGFSCDACNVPARVDIENPSLGVRHLSCPECNKMWTEAFEDVEAVH